MFDEKTQEFIFSGNFQHLNANQIRFIPSTNSNHVVVYTVNGTGLTSIHGSPQQVKQLRFQLFEISESEQRVFKFGLELGFGQHCDFAHLFQSLHDGRLSFFVLDKGGKYQYWRDCIYQPGKCESGNIGMKVEHLTKGENWCVAVGGSSQNLFRITLNQDKVNVGKMERPKKELPLLRSFFGGNVEDEKLSDVVRIKQWNRRVFVLRKRTLEQWTLLDHSNKLNWTVDLHNIVSSDIFNLNCHLLDLTFVSSQNRVHILVGGVPKKYDHNETPLASYQIYTLRAGRESAQVEFNNPIPLKNPFDYEPEKESVLFRNVQFYSYLDTFFIVFRNKIVGMVKNKLHLEAPLMANSGSAMFGHQCCIFSPKIITCYCNPFCMTQSHPDFSLPKDLDISTQNQDSKYKERDFILSCFNGFRSMKNSNDRSSGLISKPGYLNKVTEASLFLVDTPSISFPGLSTDGYTSLITEQLETKKQYHTQFLNFLEDWNVWGKLSLKNRSTLLSHGEKLEVAMSILRRVNSQYFTEFLLAVIKKCFKKRRTSVNYQELSTQENFAEYFAKPSLLQDFFIVLDMVPQFVNEGVNSEKRFSFVCDLVVGSFQSLENYRSDNREFYDSQPDWEKHPNINENLEEIIVFGHRSIAQKLKDIQSSLQTLLYSDLFRLSDILLNHLVNDVSMKDRKNRVISLMLDAHEIESATTLAEKYMEFSILVKICRESRDIDKVNSYLDRFKDSGFANILFHTFYQHKEYHFLLMTSKKHWPELSEFAKGKHDISWMVSIIQGKQIEAAENLHTAIDDATNLSLSDYKTCSSIMKICAHLGCDEKLVDLGNYQLRVSSIHEMISSNCQELAEELKALECDADQEIQSLIKISKRLSLKQTPLDLIDVVCCDLTSSVIKSPLGVRLVKEIFDLCGEALDLCQSKKQFLSLYSKAWEMDFHYVINYIEKEESILEKTFLFQLASAHYSSQWKEYIENDPTHCAKFQELIYQILINCTDGRYSSHQCNKVFNDINKLLRQNHANSK